MEANEIESAPNRPGRLRLGSDALFYLFGREATVLISSISFSFLLSVFPVIVLLLTIANLIGWSELQETTFQALYQFFPISQDFIVRNLKIYTQSVGPVQFVSLILLLWAGSTFFFALEAGLDSAYRVPRFRNFMYSQFLGSLVALLSGLAVFAALALVRLSHFVSGNLPASPANWRSLVEFAISFGLIVVLFFSIYYFLPNRRRRARAVLPETLVGAALWMTVNVIFRELAPSWSLQRIYGPFYVSVTLLLWGYVSGCILIGCARLSKDGFFGKNEDFSGAPTPATKKGRQFE